MRQEILWKLVTPQSPITLDRYNCAQKYTELQISLEIEPEADPGSRQFMQNKNKRIRSLFVWGLDPRMNLLSCMEAEKGAVMTSPLDR